MFNAITTEMEDCKAKVCAAVDSPDNDEKHLALLHVSYKLKDFSDGLEDLLKAINASMDILQEQHEESATERSYKAGLGVSDWESFMPREWQVLNTALNRLGEYRK